MVNDPNCPNPYSLANGQTVGPEFAPNPNPTQANGYTPIRPGSTTLCPPTTLDIASYAFQFTKNNDACVQDSLLTESLMIGGADLIVYKLQGVHEQCQLVDATGHGNAISGGDLPNYPSSNAFEVYQSEWRSVQVGSAVLASAYIGYDFGDIKTLDQTRRMYGIDTAIHKHITAFAIKQSANPKNRCTRVRLEYSNDNCKWYGAGIANLPDDDNFNTILMKRSAPARYWRLRPVAFNGGTANPCIPGQTIQTGGTGTVDYWAVQAIQMFHNYEATDIGNIQDKILMENRDRSYASEPITLKGFYNVQEPQTELSRFGIEMPTLSYVMELSFTQCVAYLGRPLVIGDAIMLPSETQYSARLDPLHKWLEVTDVTWSVNGYTPTWVPLMLRVTAQPMYITEETQDIFGDLAEEPVPDGAGLQTEGNGRNQLYQDFSDITTFIKTTALDNVPENGRETSGLIQQFTDDELANAQAQGLDPNNLLKIGLNPTVVYGEDAMPPNNAPFTEGPTLPPNPKDKDYHRLTYTGASAGIPPRLYRYSETKNRWIFLEQDRRQQFNPRKPILKEFIQSPGSTKEHAILKDPIPTCDPPADPNIP